ncbi:hypothetical protein D049_0084A, partial [Vibrio parahaemolyticus VPTS-2010]
MQPVLHRLYITSHHRPRHV